MCHSPRVSAGPVRGWLLFSTCRTGSLTGTLYIAGGFVWLAHQPTTLTDTCSSPPCSDRLVDGAQPASPGSSNPPPANGTPAPSSASTGPYIVPFWQSLSPYKNSPAPANGTPPASEAGSAAPAAAINGRGSSSNGGKPAEEQESGAEAATLSALSSLVTLTQQMAAEAAQDADVYASVGQLLDQMSDASSAKMLGGGSREGNEGGSNASRVRSI